ncbi:MAG: NrdH-redoxin [Candidatus Nealsonbacteria bacterium RBG_13_38_11]|uniref:NrdH-redoxin n=1 Tax=Candidatus Nealsonbacteria bacterium RBG_13_38_11 TaxID=1801662 RepID=A0A1G2E0Q0_9BACT|nr:MAG: NrdH-redoxin [Candidatus Nealsonbacteria bacterium RBG_13_38_11]
MVRIFTTPACPYCLTLKGFLKDHNVAFEEIDVSQDSKSCDYIIEKTGKMEVPVIDIEGEVIAGFDRQKIVKLLKIKD